MSLKHFLVIVAASLLLSVTMVRSGLLYRYGYGYWGPNGHDAIWHLAVIRQAELHLPPKNPVFSQSFLTNYHWGFDFFTAIIHYLTKMDLQTIYFRILPVLTAISYGIFSYLFFLRLTNNRPGALIFVLLNFFAGSFGWVVNFFRSGQIGGESLFWSMQGASTLLNPPFSLSLVILFFALWLALKKTNPLLVGAIFGLLSLVKVYASILLGLSLFICIIASFRQTNFLRSYYFRLFTAFCLVSLAVFFLLGYFNSASLLVWQPLWFVHSLVESADKLYWPQLASYRYNLSQNLSLLKLPIFLLIELFLVLLFLLGNFGTRVIGLFRFKLKSEISRLIWPLIFFSLIIPLFFVQKGTAWNTIQFLYYGLIFSNIFLAGYLSSLINKRQFFLCLLIFLLTVITSVGTFRDYFGNPSPSALPKAEILSLSFLAKQPDGIVLAYPYNPYLKSGLATPIPLSLYETTAYIPAFSGKVVYLADEMNADILGLDWRLRQKLSVDFFTGSNRFQDRGFLVNNNISYIYLSAGQSLALSPPELEIDQIYNENGIRIYQVRR